MNRIFKISQIMYGENGFRSFKTQGNEINIPGNVIDL